MQGGLVTGAILGRQKYYESRRLLVTFTSCQDEDNTHKSSAFAWFLLLPLVRRFNTWLCLNENLVPILNNP